MTTTENETKVETQASKEEALPTENVEKVDENKVAVDAPASPTKQKTETLKPALSVHKKDFEKDVVYLYQFVRSGAIPSLSACCMKVENWLRMNGVRYENVDHKLRFKSKKGQIPFVELNGKEIEDSDNIIKELSRYFDKDLDAGLTDEQKTTSYAFISMLDNHTGWIVRWWRYNNPQEFMQTAQFDIKRTFNSRIPNSILNFVFKIGFKKLLRDSLGSGTGRFTNEEVIEGAKEDLKALSNLLGNKDWFFGKEPHLLDCVAFAHLAQFIHVPFGGIKEFMETQTPNLLALVERMKNKYWPDWEEMCSTLDLNTHLPKKEITADGGDDQQKTDDEKKKKEKKEKKEKKNKKKEKSEENAVKDETVKTETITVVTSKDVTEVAKQVTDAVSATVNAVAPNGGEAPKPAEQVTASE